MRKPQTTLSPHRNLPAATPRPRSIVTAWGSTLLLLLLVFSAACVSVVQRGSNLDDDARNIRRVQQRGYFPFQGESFTFIVRHAATNMEVLRAGMSVGVEHIAEDGARVIPIFAEANSASLLRFFARIRDTAETYLDPDTWMPFYAVKDLNENDRERAFHVWYWSENLAASVERIAPDGVTRRELSLPLGTMDAIAWIFHARSMPLEKGAQGAWFIFDGWILSRLLVVVQAKEEVWTPLGFYSAYRLDLYREKLESHSPIGALAGVFVDPELTLESTATFIGNCWIADDPYRTPVRLAIATSVGDLDFILDTYQPPRALPNP